MKSVYQGGMTTIQFSAQIGIKPESIRVRLCPSQTTQWAAAVAC